MELITISRQFGSGGEEIARRLAEKLNYILVDKKMISTGLAAYGFDESMEELDEKIIRDDGGSALNRNYINALHDYFYDLAIRENLVVLGRGAQVLFRDFPPAFHVKIIAPLPQRAQKMMRRYNLKEEAALKLVQEKDEYRAEYMQHVFNVNWADMELYDLVVNTGNIAVEDAVDLIAASLHICGNRELSERDRGGDMPVENGFPADVHSDEVAFMHPSEEEFAKILDFYRIKWEYEPKTFVLEWDSEGNVAEAFAPDFYLPEQDLYVELTTQKQKLVWKKNKKVRRLQELYPDVQIKIIYNRDYKGLLEKFGLDE